MVKVLRHNCPPEESGLAAEQLEAIEAKYGCGTLLDQVYVCALPAGLREALEEINAAPSPPPISLEIQPAMLSIASWLVQLGSEKAMELMELVLGVDEEWAECVRRAAAQPPLRLVTPPPQRSLSVVKVLRHNHPPEESGEPAELEATYGWGKLLPDEQIYLCALPAGLREALEAINAAPSPPPISLEDEPASRSIRMWLLQLGWSEETKALLGFMRVKLDEEWADCVRRGAAKAPTEPPLLQVTPRLQVEASVTSALSRGWQSKYDDPLGVVDYLGGVLDDYMANWRTGRYHAAWTMVLQSSGWGKSRSIQELATKGVHVAYVSFMNRQATGMPGRSDVADVLSDPEDPRCIAAWVVAILLQIKKSTPEEWRRSQESIVGEVSQSYKELKEDVIPKVQHQSPPRTPWSPDQLRDWLHKKLSGFSTPVERKVVFCLDEAASLFKQKSGAFLAFRRFFSAIPKHANLFGLVADTAGKLGMVFPPSMYDPSARAVDGNAEFFDPVWVVGRAYREPDKLQRLMSEQEDVALVSEEFTRELFRMGRPLWRALLDNQASLDGAVQFASEKLLNGISPQTLKKLPRHLMRSILEPMATAIIGVVAGLEVAAWSELAQHMVAGHMRSVSHVSGDRECVFTGDVIEPILGEAAAHLLDDVELLLLVLRFLGDVLKQALVVEGPRGEVVGRLLLALAMYHCCRKRTEQAGWRWHEMFSHPVTLSNFLSVLSGRKVTARGLVFFNRFMFLNMREIGRELLLFCFLCGFAIIPQRNQAGFDALLPCLVPGPDGKYQLLPDRMRAVPVQIRNRQAHAVKADKLLACLSSWTPAEQGKSAAEQGKSPEVEARTSTHEGDAAKAARIATQRVIAYEATKTKDLGMKDYFGADCGRPFKKQRTVAKEEEIKLGDECGLYLHVQGKGVFQDQVDITEDSKVLVLRGVRFLFLEERVSAQLEKMCDAFYKVEDDLKVDQSRGKFVHHNFNNCFKLRKEGVEAKSREPDLLLNKRNAN